MLEEFFFCTAFVGLLLLIAIYWQATIGDSLDPLSAEQVARLRHLANKYPSVHHMVKMWLTRKNTLRLHHLEKAEDEANYIEHRAQCQREQQRAAAEQMSLLASAPLPVSILEFPKNLRGRE
ncbi:hypothetical protein [Burkholderia gladioli]|uniref:hypothetical protein n=1 Tax=Burkholderia gladioli TaxID=28095 RepID=UPI00163E72CD|nr:hypothetical protein [Burkholderia gladioli]